MRKRVVAAAALLALAAGAGWWTASRFQRQVEVAETQASPAPERLSRMNRAPASAALAVLTLGASPPQPLALRVIEYQGSVPLSAVTDASGTHSVESIFGQVNLAVAKTVNTRAYTFGNDYLTQADLSTLATEVLPPLAGWEVTGYMLRYGTASYELGMLLPNTRNRFGVFTKAHGSGARVPHAVLRTAAHEIGHALNLFHNDGNSSPSCCTGGGTGTSLMNQDTCLAANWTFSFDTRELDHLRNHPLTFLDPRGPSAFGMCDLGHRKKC